MSITTCKVCSGIKQSDKACHYCGGLNIGDRVINISAPHRQIVRGFTTKRIHEIVGPSFLRKNAVANITARLVKGITL